MKRYGFSVCFLILLFIIPTLVYGQMKRQRVRTVESVSSSYSTPNFMAQSTVRQVDAGNLNVSIMHSFGIATQNVFENFFGIDRVQNVRLGVDFGITDRWSAGIGRSSLLNVVDLRSKYALVRQISDDSVPLSLSLEGDLAVVTQNNNKPVSDDISSYFGILLSRKFSDGFSVQLSPGMSHFNNVPFGNYHNLYTVSLGSEIALSDRYSLITEYYPVLGNRNPGTKNAFTLGLNIETGGHVFQLFFTSAYWHLDQYILAQNRDQFWNGDFRFGFNVNRIFRL